MKTDNTKENLCDSCLNQCSFPECLPDNVEYGNNVGNDNIISCDNYQE